MPENQQKAALLPKLAKVAIGHVAHAKNYLKDYRKNDSLKRRVDALFLGDQVSRVLVNSKWYDKFCDPIIDKLKTAEFTSLHMEPLHQYHTPRYNPGMFIQPHLDWLRIRSLLQMRTGINYDQLQGFKELLTCLENMGNNSKRSTAIKNCTILKTNSGWFDKIIKRTQHNRFLLFATMGLKDGF